MKLLICDDSLIIRSGLESQLNKTGNWSQIRTAKNGKEGLEILKSDPPDLLCLDIEMPEMDGLEVLKHIRQMKSDGTLPKNFPVVVLSGIMFENDENVRKAKMLGATKVLSKPKGESSTTGIKVDEFEKELLGALPSA